MIKRVTGWVNRAEFENEVQDLGNGVYAAIDVCSTESGALQMADTTGCFPDNTPIQVTLEWETDE